MSRSESISIRKTVENVPSLPYEAMARSILGPNYELSLVVCGDTLAQKMNIRYRSKSYYPNVLSFPYSKTEGEIFLNIRKAAREARTLGCTTKERAALLFVHGCYHLAGHDHSDAMEALEHKTLKKFGLAQH